MSQPAPLRADPNPGVVRSALHLAYDLGWMVAIIVGFPWLAFRSIQKRSFLRMVRERGGSGLDVRGGGQPRPCILVHGVSVGEVMAARSLVQALEEALPDTEIVLSATTDTGMQMARQCYPEHSVVRFPADLSPLVARFLRRIQPDSVVLVELEVWPNFLRECNRRGVPVAVVNGRITDRSHGRYRLFRRLFPQFNRLSLVAVQAEEYAQRFRELGVAEERLMVTGNIKVDGLSASPGGELGDLARWLAVAPGQALVVAGSTHSPEELLVARAWRESIPSARLVLVPRHPDRAPQLLAELDRAGIGAQRLTALRAGGQEVDPLLPLIADTIGELQQIYSQADLAFVGGSLVPHGGQNVLEPAALGIPVLHGPCMDNFMAEAALLAQNGAAEAVDRAGLGVTMARLLGDPGQREGMGEAGRKAVDSQRGATGRTVRALVALGICD